MFEGKYVVITGGSSGIGLACARGFAAKGADVAIVARDPARLEAARETVMAARISDSQTVNAISADVSSWEGARAAMSRATTGRGTPDILVNSAGVILPGNFESMPIERFVQNMECGYFTVVWPTRAIASEMIDRGSGHIVNVSSVAGFIGVFGYTGYSAAKYAVMGFSESLRQEMKPYGVRVSVVCPPDTDTPALTYEKTLRPPETDAVAGNIKAISPDAVAEAIIAGVSKNRYLIIPDLSSKLYYRLKGVLPELFYAVLDADVRKARGPASDTR